MIQKNHSKNSITRGVINKHEQHVRIGLIIFIIFGFLANSLFLYSNYKTTPQLPDYGVYPRLSKRVFIQDSNDLIVNFVPLRKALKNYVARQDGKVGAYFEYLPSGSSVGANDTEEIKLASLSKVPLVMSILKKIEKGELNGSTKISLQKEHLNSSFGDLWKSGVGATFTIKELLEYTIKYSDNTAYETLFFLLTDEEVIEVYDALEIEVASKETDPHISPKSYSSIFRSLYLATYNSKEDSNYLLDLLTKTIFTDKLPSGIPKSVLVSHKIGVFATVGSPERVYSDCGIVYYPLRPYILCVFVQDTEAKSIEHISYISKMVYGYVDLVQGNK